MSGFCVFGMTEPLAKSLAARKAPPKTMKGATYEQIDAWRVEQALKILEAGRVRQVSPAFDAPQFCRDWIEVAQRTVRATRLNVMVRDVKTDKKGNIVTRKKSTVPLMTWRPYQG